jgi:transposase
VFTNMHLWSEIRRRVRTGEISMRQACAEYRLNWRTVKKVVTQPEPEPRPPAPRPRPVLDPVVPLIHAILEADRAAPPRQRHTAVRIYQRLCDEHGYQGCLTGVRDVVRAWKGSRAEVFVPLLHPPGEAQGDFGRAVVEVAGERVPAALFVLTLPYSGAVFGCLFPRECTEAFHQGHARAFAFFGGVPSRISYDNSKIAVTKVTGPHERELTAEFCRLRGHFLFASHFCNVRRAHEKGHVEGGVGYVRRNFLVPVPRAAGWEELNARLAQSCARDQARQAAGQAEAKGARLAADRAAFRPLPAEPFESRRVAGASISSLSLGRFDGNDYSVPTAYAYRTLTVLGTLDRVRFLHQGTVVAEHRRCWGKRQTVYDPVHYLALLERKPGALDHAAPLKGWALPGCFARLRRRLEEADPAGGTRQYIRVLRLLEVHDLAALTVAVEAALALSVKDADAVRLLVARQADTPAASFDLAGRPRLQAVRVPPPDLGAYAALARRKGVRP